MKEYKKPIIDEKRDLNSINHFHHLPIILLILTFYIFNNPHTQTERIETNCYIT